MATTATRVVQAPRVHPAGGRRRTVLVTDRDRAVVSSRLLEREVWNRINARRLQPVKRRQIAAKPECPPRPS